MRGRFLIALSVALVSDVSCVGAQRSPALAGLRPPDAELRCRALSLPPNTAPGSIAFQFEDGQLRVNDRLISAVYDSAGTPILLVVNATEQKGDETVMHVYSFSFPTGGGASGFEVLDPLATTATREVPREQLSIQVVEQSRTLAEWLWAHRCESSAKAPN
jgi:hypothetical protein